jgi:RNA polymerase sigma-70 factor (ECF subfamily)
MSEPIEVGMMNVVPIPSRRSERLHDDFRELFAAAYPQVVRTVWFVVHDQGMAEEITQDAFLELYRDWPRLRGYDRPELWVRRVAIRRAQREASRQVRRIAVERAARGVELVDEVSIPDPDLIAAIRALPPKQRAILVLFYLEDRPMEEVAGLVGCSKSTGFVQLHQARKRLAAVLGEEVDSDVR